MKFKRGDLVSHSKGGLYEVLYIHIDMNANGYRTYIYKSLNGEDNGVIYSMPVAEFEEKFEKAEK